MKKIKFAYYQGEKMLVGYLEDHPDYMTQGVDIEELKKNLKDIYKDIVDGKVEDVRRHGELVIS